jgi:hypothetical protein
MEVAHVPGMRSGRIPFLCAQKNSPGPTQRTGASGYSPTGKWYGGQAIRLASQIWGGLKRLLARCRSLGNMLLSGCPWVAFQIHPGSSCSSPFASAPVPLPGLRFYYAPAAEFFKRSGSHNRGQKSGAAVKRIAELHNERPVWEGELEPCQKC